MSIASILEKSSTSVSNPKRKQYVRLVHHFSSNNSAQVEELRGLMRDLGIAPSQVDADLRVISEASSLRMAAASTTSTRAERDEAAKALQDHLEYSQRWHLEWKAKYGKLYEASNALNVQHDSAEQSAGLLRRLEQLRPDLFEQDQD